MTGDSCPVCPAEEPEDSCKTCYGTGLVCRNMDEVIDTVARFGRHNPSAVDRLADLVR